MWSRLLFENWIAFLFKKKTTYVVQTFCRQVSFFLSARQFGNDVKLLPWLQCQTITGAASASFWSLAKLIDLVYGKASSSCNSWWLNFGCRQWIAELWQLIFSSWTQIWTCSTLGQISDGCIYLRWPVKGFCCRYFSWLMARSIFRYQCIPSCMPWRFVTTFFGSLCHR